MNNFFNVSKLSALESQYEAQKIAFAPVIFQVARVLRDSGILKLIEEAKDGLEVSDISEKLSMSDYSVGILLESGLSAGIVSKDNDRFFDTKIGYFILNDEMTRINMDFNHYVNYLGLYELENSIKTKKPCGLKTFNNDDTIYPGLSKLPKDVKKAWFDFDHFYSDSAFVEAIKILKKHGVQKLLEIGGNTGKFAILCANSIPSCHITMADLPGQLDVAKQTIKDIGLSDKIDTYYANMLDESTQLPDGFDSVWMSQFLDCFSEEDIIKILQKVSNAVDSNGKIFILEPIWDRQRYETSAYCIINTSPYFTALANGKSKMFNFGELNKLITKSGLFVSEIHDCIGFSHSLIICKKMEDTK
jgi:hypothetical protein